MNISRIGFIILFIAVVVLSGLHGFWVQSFLSLGLISILCFTVHPWMRILIPDKTDAAILTFPAGFTIYAVFFSFAGLVLGVHRWVAIVCVAIAVVAYGVTYWMQKGNADKSASSWTRSDFALLFLWLFTSLVIVALPFARVGAETPDGFAYRAYFNADFFRNMAVAGSLAHNNIPPDNPYLGGYTLHYYWFFHLLDAFWRELFPGFRPDSLMVQFSLVAMLIFVSTFFVVLRRFTQNRKTSLLLLPIFAFGGSYEGPYVIQWLRNRHQPWTEFVNLNIDGILRWNWKAPQIDTLYRALLYAPQHLIALAIFLIALLIWNSERLKEEPLRCNTRRTIFYFLIFATLGFSAFVGATLIAGAAVVLGVRTLMNPRMKWKELILSGTLGLIFLFVYLRLFHMFAPGSQELDLGPDKIISAHFLSYFVLNWGALLIFGIAGLFLRSKLAPNRILFIFLAGCFLMIYFVRIVLAGSSDISLKVGHFANVILLLVAAGFIDGFLTRFPQKVKWLIAVTVLLVAPAFVTWGMDAWNSADIKNRRFTTYLKQEDAEVCKWMQSNLPEKTVVLNYSPRYEDFMQDFIPAFAERSVFVGNRIFSRIFQVPETDVRDRTNVVSAFLRFTSTEQTHQVARKAGIQYVFVSGLDSRKLSELTTKLASPYFSLVMQEGKAALFRVNDEP